MFIVTNRLPDNWHKLLLCGEPNFARFCIHEFLNFFVLIELGVFSSKLGVMIGKSDINVCVD